MFNDQTLNNDNLANILKKYNYMDLEQEQYKGQLSEEEIIRLSWDVKQNFIKTTIEQFANEYEGDTLSIYYKNNVQIGFARLSKDFKKQTILHRTMQNILFDIEHPAEGLIVFNLNEYRNSTKV